MHPSSILNAFLWNTFLALVPVALAYIIWWMDERRTKHPSLKLVMIVLLLAWLAFLPNASYLVSQWRHYLLSLDSANLYLRARLSSEATIWLMLYTAFFFCYSALGMVAFTVAIRPIARIARREGGILWVWGLLLFLSVSVGVYLGLILRFNTWDLLARPEQVWHAIVSLVSRPRLSAFIVAFAGFLWLSYFLIDVWIDGLIARWNAISRTQSNTETPSTPPEDFRCKDA